MKLYELTHDYMALLEAIDNDEIPEEAIADTLEGITAEIEDKADNIACLLKNLESDITAISTEEKRLAERRKTKERTYERIKTYLSDTLQSAGFSKLETARNKVTFRRSESVEITDNNAFMEYAKEHEDLLTFSAPTVNKTAVKKFIKEGNEIAGAVLVSKNNIQIK